MLYHFALLLVLLLLYFYMFNNLVNFNEFDCCLLLCILNIIAIGFLSIVIGICMDAWLLLGLFCDSIYKLRLYGIRLHRMNHILLMLLFIWSLVIALGVLNVFDLVLVSCVLLYHHCWLGSVVVLAFHCYNAIIIRSSRLVPCKLPIHKVLAFKCLSRLKLTWLWLSEWFAYQTIVREVISNVPSEGMEFVATASYVILWLFAFAGASLRRIYMIHIPSLIICLQRTSKRSRHIVILILCRQLLLYLMQASCAQTIS